MGAGYVNMAIRKLGFRKIIFCFALGWLSAKSSAYPNFISYGYQSCMSCHYNPLGNGPLTDYGRAVAATAISDRWIFSKEVANDDEKLADFSGFLFSKPKTKWFRPSASYRGLYLVTDYGKPNAKDDYIHMDASIGAVAKFLEGDRLIISAQIGYAPEPRSAHGSGKKYDDYRSREHYIGFRFTKQFGLYAGLMDKAYGIRVPDHIAFSRTITGLAQNDQTYAVLGHYFNEKFELALQPFIGNLVQDAPLRQKGITGQVGYALRDNVRIGFSNLLSQSDFQSLAMLAADARMGFSKGTSLMIEVGQVVRTIKGPDTKSTSHYVFLQNHWLMRPGTFLIFTGEYLQPDTGSSQETYRFGPGLQYFLAPHVELRSDIYNTRTRSPGSFSDDTWVVTAQAHLWF